MSQRSLVFLALLIIVITWAGCAAPGKQQPASSKSGQAGRPGREAVLAFNQGIGLLRGKRADYYQAVACFERAVRIHPRFYEANFNLGLLYARGNDFSRSVAAYERALEARQSDRAASFNLAAVYLAIGDFERAIDLFEHFVERDPDDFESRNNLAVLLRKKGDYDRAIKQARYVLDRAHQQVLAYNNLATIFSEQGRHEMAEDLFRRALALEPDDPRVLNNLGLARLKWDKVQEALDLFLKAFERNPRLEEAGLNAASVHMDSGDYHRSAAIYKRIAEHIPGFLPALVGHAVAERGLSRYQKAEESYKQILGLDPTNPESLFNLGILYMKYREKPEWACQALHRFLRSGRTTKELEGRARSYLEDLRLSHPDACANPPGEKK